MTSRDFIMLYLTFFKGTDQDKTIKGWKHKKIIYFVDI